MWFNFPGLWTRQAALSGNSGTDRAGEEDNGATRARKRQRCGDYEVVLPSNSAGSQPPLPLYQFPSLILGQPILPAPISQILRHDPQYYFDDGNIVLIAEDRVFRVHKGILSMYSSIFKDMLGLPQPSGSETIDGCPAVRLPDSAYHIDLLLETIYKGPTTPLLRVKTTEATTIKTLYNLSWIADKYAVQHVIDHVYQKLLAMLPADSLYDFASFDECMKEANILRNGPERVELAQLIHMIRLWHPRASHLLPLLFYARCQCPLQDVCALHLEELMMPQWQQEMQRCLRAIPQLYERKMRMCNAFAMVGTCREECYNQHQCDEALFHLSRYVMERENAAKLPCPLEDLTGWCNQQLHWRALCADCKQEVEVEICRVREETWEELGKIFDIPEWKGDVTSLA